jgi:hypothetical protein
MNASKPPPLLFLVDCLESPIGGSYYSTGASVLGGAAVGNFFLAGEGLDLFIYIIVNKIENL